MHRLAGAGHVRRVIRAGRRRDAGVVRLAGPAALARPAGAHRLQRAAVAEPLAALAGVVAGFPQAASGAAAQPAAIEVDAEELVAAIGGLGSRGARLMPHTRLALALPGLAASLHAGEGQ